MELDWSKVSDVLAAAKLPNNIDGRSMRRCVVDAVDKWFASDATNYRILSLEEDRTIPMGGDASFKYRIDMVLEARRDVPKLKIKEGDKIIVDYKTSSLDLSGSYGKSRFREIYGQENKQPAYYKYCYPEARWFWFRGVSKQHGGGTCDLLIHLKDTALLPDDFHATHAIREALRPVDGFWYRNFENCNAYGYQCPHYTNCRINNIPATGDIKIPSHMSYSQITSFWACPERYKRDRLIGVEGIVDSGEAGLFGKVFHDCIHAIYSQLYV
jgi:hypothetical protein